MTGRQSRFGNLPARLTTIACLMLALLAPGWRQLLRALDYASLANCALPAALNLTARIGDGPSTHTLYVAHDLTPGCNVTNSTPFTASATFLNGGDSWLTVTPASGTLQPASRNAVRVVFTPALLPDTGTFQGFVHIRVPSINGTISVPVNATLTASGPQIGLSTSTVVYQAVTQTGPPAPQTVRLANTGVGQLDWTIDTAAIPSWLRISPTSGSISAGASPTAIVLVPTTAALTGNAYNALLPIRSATAKNSPQYLSVVYHVVQPTAGATPLLSDYNLNFLARAGSTTAQEKTVVLSNTGGSTLTATFQARTTVGNWLSITPTTAAVQSGAPVTMRITANPTGLTGGIYRGTITGTFSNRVPQTVEVLLVIAPATSAASGIAPSSASDAGSRAALDGCTPTSMTVLGSTVGTGINSPVSFPQSLVAQVVDSCGDAVTNATLIATAAGANIPLNNTGGGSYSGTWSPTQAATNVPIIFTAFHPLFASVQATYNVTALTASGGTVLPVLFNDGVVEGAGFTQRRPLVPGGIISLFGSNLATGIASASTIPLERKLEQTSVRIGGVDAPLYFVSPGQINAQVPFESRPGEQAAVVVNVGGKLTAPQNYLIAPAQPGIFTDSLGPAILDDQFRRVTGLNPARVGRVIQMFVGGLGDTVPPVESGGALNAGSDAAVPVTVEIGGLNAPVQYNGLAPGYVGLYQVNVTVPNVTTGPSVPLILRQNGVPANPSQTITIPVGP